MKKKMLVCLLLAICLLPIHAMAGLYWGTLVRITSKSAVNVRAEPNAKSKMLGEAMSTNTYTWLKTEGDWHYIQFTGDLRGYVPTKYTQLEEGLIWNDFMPNEADAVVSNTHYNALHVRTEPDKDSSVIGSIKPDSTWPYRGTENGWNRILYGDVYAYVAANRTAIEVVDSTAGATSSKSSVTVIGDSMPGLAGATGALSTVSLCSECTAGVCSTCGGSGEVYSRKAGGPIVCPSCEGDEACWRCGGDGVP